VQVNPIATLINLPPRRSSDSESDSLDMPLPSPIKLQPKWIHRRLWASEDPLAESHRSSLLGTVVPRSWSKDRAARNNTSLSEKAISTTNDHVATVKQPGALARSASISPSIASSVRSSRTAVKPAKSALTSQRTISTKPSRISRSCSGSAHSVKFADVPTYYYDYEYEYHAHEHPTISESDVEFHSPPLPPSPAPLTTFSRDFTAPRESARVTSSCRANKVRQALKRLLPTTIPRSSLRSSTISISGPYPLWKDSDGASIRSERSIPSSVRSVPATHSKAKNFWGRVMAHAI